MHHICSGAWTFVRVEGQEELLIRVGAWPMQRKTLGEAAAGRRVLQGVLLTPLLLSRPAKRIVPPLPVRLQMHPDTPL